MTDWTVNVKVAGSTVSLRRRSLLTQQLYRKLLLKVFVDDDTDDTADTLDVQQDLAETTGFSPSFVADVLDEYLLMSSRVGHVDDDLVAFADAGDDREAVRDKFLAYIQHEKAQAIRDAMVRAFNAMDEPDNTLARGAGGPKDASGSKPSPNSTESVPMNAPSPTNANGKKTSRQTSPTSSASSTTQPTT